MAGAACSNRPAWTPGGPTTDEMKRSDARHEARAPGHQGVRRRLSGHRRSPVKRRPTDTRSRDRRRPPCVDPRPRRRRHGPPTRLAYSAPVARACCSGVSASAARVRSRRPLRPRPAGARRGFRRVARVRRGIDTPIWECGWLARPGDQDRRARRRPGAKSRGPRHAPSRQAGRAAVLGWRHRATTARSLHRRGT